MRRPRGFSLGEVLLAILFLSIAFFGYVALHQRLIYSSWRLEQRQSPREEARQELMTRLEAARIATYAGAPSVPGVSPGLQLLRVEKVWELPSRQNVDPEQHRYSLDTYVVVRRPGW